MPQLIWLIWVEGLILGTFEFGPAVQEMFKDVSIFFCLAAQSRLSYFGWGPYEEHLGEIILNLGQQFSRILSYKDIFIFSSGGQFCWEERNRFDNFGRGPYEEHLCGL